MKSFLMLGGICAALVIGSVISVTATFIALWAPMLVGELYMRYFE